MKTSGILAVAAGAALAAAQLDQIPTCALTCAISSIGASGCAQTDIACVCSASSFLSGILTCIQGTCTAAEIQKTLGAAQVLCAGAGVTITVPGATSTTAAPTSTSAPVETTPPVETATEETSTAVETSTSSVVAPPTYDTTSSVVTLTTTTTYCPSSTTVIPTYVAPPAQNTTVPVPPPTYTGAAGSVAANAGAVIVGAALAMFFA
ncbi:hypothetical protein H072_10042 [Dactylellina haptotyla CBS 200.50]|uniref:CFEM domain-containing protein n=2 Tax=Dactylellina haptotyla TaxID=430498 RepID=S8A5U0_DACHA|nr:GPI anchored CFEM domain protein [Dactylellina haptotyla]EPS36491.1 hypothetical protein H072_10042 [Dactylellina haptotyla CBS 200.50]